MCRFRLVKNTPCRWLLSIWANHLYVSHLLSKVIRTSRVLELIHTDVFGPVSEEAWDGSKYFVAFTDDFSSASIVYCMELKSEVFEKFKEFVAHHCKKVKNLDCSSIAKLKADNGGEYVSNDLKNYCKGRGIQIIYTVAYNPEMNGVSERLNRRAIELMKMLITFLMMISIPSFNKAGNTPSGPGDLKE